jgi:N-acetylglutamate synthase-like GNAT family acetyltransferase
MGVVIRAATAGDQAAIRAIIREAQLNPMSLDWPRFVVAEDEGQVVAVGQVKPHSDGSRELASIAVIPSRQRAGLGQQIIRALLAREPGPLYLVCVDDHDSYYQQFGFRRVGVAALPPTFRRLYRVGWIVTAIGLRLAGRQGEMIAMYRPAPLPESTSSGPPSAGGAA